MSQCAITDCENTEMAPVLYDGRVYCVEHYDQFIWDGFYTQYQSWKKDDHDAPSGFKYILDRISDEGYFELEGDGFLNAVRIRDRGFNFVKTDNGCTFEITRHLNAWESKRKPRRIVEKWNVDLDSKTIQQVSIRKFTKKDFDPVT